ncbi:MAG: hypothetical protein QXF76_00605 [Candidatus Anstonellales archaeon]
MDNEFPKKLYRCPTKLILIGEHFAVYNKKAIAMPVEPYNFLTISESLIDGIEIYLNKKSISLEKNAYYFMPVVEYIRRTKRTDVRKRYSINLNGFKGMGNSASLAALFTYATLQEYSLYDEKIFLSLAFECENLAHGQKASGIDLQTILSKKPIIYQKLSNNEKSFLEIEINIPEDFSLLAISTQLHNQKSDSTSKMIKKFADSYGNALQSICDEYETLFEEFLNSLNKKDFYNIAKLMNEVNELLLPVSTRTIESLRKLLLSNGALGAKISGAGGNGSVVICLTDRRYLPKISKLLTQNKFNFFEVKILNSNNGVERIENGLF